MDLLYSVPSFHLQYKNNSGAKYYAIHVDRCEKVHNCAIVDLQKETVYDTHTGKDKINFDMQTELRSK